MKTHEGSREGRRLSRKTRNPSKDENAIGREGQFQIPNEMFKKLPNSERFEEDNVQGNVVQEMKGKDVNNINLDDLPICDPEYNHSSPNSFYAAQLLSPPYFNSKLNYGMPNPQIFLKPLGSSVTPGTYNQNLPKLASPGPKDFLGGYADFTSFAQDVGGVNGLLLEPGNTSPYLPDAPYTNAPYAQPIPKEESEENKP
jgi:hypothetical protein